MTASRRPRSWEPLPLGGVKEFQVELRTVHLGDKLCCYAHGDGTVFWIFDDVLEASFSCSEGARDSSPGRRGARLRLGCRLRAVTATVQVRS